MPEIRKPDTAASWAGWAGIALAARVAWVYLADHLAGAGGHLTATPNAGDQADTDTAVEDAPPALLAGSPHPRLRSTRPRKKAHMTTTHAHPKPGLLEAAHEPPQRVKGFWAPFDTALAARSRAGLRSGRWVFCGIDANRGNPEQLAKKAGLVWHSTDDRRIDGFLASPDVKVHNIRALPKGTSDHQPLVAEIEIGGVRLTVATVNDDWATAGSNFDEVRHCDVILIQEGKRERYAKLAGRGFVVRQSLVSLARAGSVIIVRKDAPLALGGYGWTFGVSAAGLLPRWIAWQRCTTLVP